MGHGTRKPAINVNEITEELKISRSPDSKRLRGSNRRISYNRSTSRSIRQKTRAKDVLEPLLVCANLDALMAERAAMKLNEKNLRHENDFTRWTFQR